MWVMSTYKEKFGIYFCVQQVHKKKETSLKKQILSWKLLYNTSGFFKGGELLSDNGQ